MKRLTLSALLLAASAAAAPASALTPSAILQFGPTTDLSTINCANFVRLPDGAWKAVVFDKFGLGFVLNIVPPVFPIKSGGYIYNNIDLYSQLELQCGGAPIVARY